MPEKTKESAPACGCTARFIPIQKSIYFSSTIRQKCYNIIIKTHLAAGTTRNGKLYFIGLAKRMDTILGQILCDLNTAFGLAGSAITIYDHFKNHNKTHITETFAAIRRKSKEAYDSYCEYREYRKSEIGTPSEEKILGYWESCLKRNIPPSVTDMVSTDTASKEEAEIMLAYLLEAWMGVPDFAEWLNGILTQHQTKQLAQALLSLQQNLKGISDFTEESRQRDISSIASVISPDRIVDAKCSCTDLDIKHYYMVDNRFHTMFRVICAGRDVPHEEAYQKALESVETRHPLIIAGNGGLGKTSLMMRTAVQWASSGRLAVWLSLSSKNTITEQEADIFFHKLTASIPDGERALLCIDNPYEGKDSLCSLQSKCPNTDKIQLVMAERANHLSLLTELYQDALLFWFDDAQMLILQGLNQFAPTFKLKDYVSFQFPETQKRRQKILEKCIQPFVREGIVKGKDKLHTVQVISRQYNRPTVSLVELIYRTLFELKKIASKPQSIKLDWEEWEDFIESEFGKGESYTKGELYGVIATLKIFNIPISISLFCKYFHFNEWTLRNHLNMRLMLQHIEPVIFQNDTLQPKHDVIAELFFLFHAKKYSVNSLMLQLLQYMDENEIEALLKKMVDKHEFQYGKKFHAEKIQYKDYLDIIYARMQKHNCNLSETGRAYLCLGYLWSRFQNGTPESNTLINNILNEIAPEIDGTSLMAKLYTEWSIFVRISGNEALAEEYLKRVIAEKPNDFIARTELGKLYTNQKDKQNEAKKLFWEAIQINPRHIQSRTELGKLLANQGFKKEAEMILREAINISSTNLHPLTELGKLLADQGCDAEAEHFLRRVIKISPDDIVSRTELGRLLSKRPGHEREAEKILLKVIQLDKKDIYARTLLAQLYEASNRKPEAAALYQKVQQLKPGDRYAKNGLMRLKKYTKEEKSSALALDSKNAKHSS